MYIFQTLILTETFGIVGQERNLTMCHAAAGS